MVLELIFSQVYDQVGTRGQYSDTLASWFEAAQVLLRDRTPVAFSDFGTPRDDSVPFSHWCVLDPVNIYHNLVMDWDAGRVEGLADALGNWRAVLR
jgi:hypothetical protein